MQIKTKFNLDIKALGEQAGAVLGKVAGKKALVVALGDFSVQGAVFERGRKGAMRLERFMEVSFETSIRNPKIKLARLLKAMGGAPCKDVLLVCGEFHHVNVDLPKPVKKRFSKTNETEVLIAAAKWEIAPFLEYPVEEAMLGLLRLPSVPQEDEDQMLLEEEEAKVPAIVFALHRKIYDQLKAVCAAFKLRLEGVMPEECYSLSSRRFEQGDAIECALAEDQTGASVIIEWRMYEALGALVDGNRPLAFARRDFDAGEDPAQAMSELIEELRYGGVDPRAFVLGGESAEESDVVEALAKTAGLPGRNWSIEQDVPAMHSPGPIPARYISAMGAVVNYTDKVPFIPVMDDRVPLKKRIMDHSLAVPAMIVFLLALALLVDFQFRSWRISGMEQRIESLSEEKKSLESVVQHESGLQKELAHLKQEKDHLKDQIHMLSHELSRRKLYMRALFAGIIQNTPPEIQLRRIHQFSEEVWLIEGESADYQVITNYVVDLKQMPVVRECRLEGSREQASRQGGGAGAARHSFSIRLRMEGA